MQLATCHWSRGTHYDLDVTNLHVQVPDDVAERVERVAHDRGVSTDEVVVEALRIHVTHQSTLPPRFIGVGHSGRGDLSERVKEILSTDLQS
jgi:hypothetical protein